MRHIRILKNSLSNAFKSLFRNFSLGLASVSCIFITLMLVAIALILSKNVNNFTRDIENDLTIVVFANKDITEEGITKLENEIKAIPNLESIEYQSKESIKNRMMQENDTYNTIMSDWTEEENPLQPCFIIKVKDPKYMGENATTIKNLENVETVKYGEGMVEDLLSIFDLISKIMLATVIALIFVTAFLISNTIKITIYSRKTEINIMRLVGTSNFVIKLPFLFEGLFLGIIGSIIPILSTIFGYNFLYNKMNGIVFTDIFTLIKPNNIVFKVSLVLLIIGGLVGMLGSVKAVRKYLKI